MNKKLIFSCLLTLFLTISNACNSEKSNSKLVNSNLTSELRDVYNAYEVNHIINNQTEMINLLINESTEVEFNKLLEDYINDLNNLKSLNYNNQTLSKYVKDYVQKTVTNYKILKEKGMSSSEFKVDFDNYKSFKSDYFKYLTSTYALNKYTNLSEEKYWSNVDKKNYIKSSQYAEYEKLKNTDLKRSIEDLENIISQTKNFQEKSIYLIEVSDLYVKNNLKFEEDSFVIAIKKYKSIIDENKYSLYLFETWMKWRAVTQQTKGLSKSSEIPNNEYDDVRKKISETILSYLNENPNDEMAINQFFLITTHDIVRRFGEYPYGNQSTIEFHQMFD